MPVVTTKSILQRAFQERYGVAAINVVNDLTLEAVLAAAAELTRPLIVQTSVKTVKSIGLGRCTHVARDDRDVPVPVSLHLDHCPDRAVISECLTRGWNSVLFDGSRWTSRRTRARRSRSSPRRAATARMSRARSRASAGSRTGRLRRGAARSILVEVGPTSSRAPGSTSSRRRSAPPTASTRPTPAARQRSGSPTSSRSPDPDGPARRHGLDARRSSAT